MSMIKDIQDESYFILSGSAISPLSRGRITRTYTKANKRKSIPAKAPVKRSEFGCAKLMVATGYDSQLLSCYRIN